MVGKADVNRQVRRTALITVALFAALVFGIVVLAGGDWIPGGITVAAALVGLARQIPVIRELCSADREQEPGHAGSTLRPTTLGE